jgi:hypothetical protein
MRKTSRKLALFVTLSLAAACSAGAASSGGQASSGAPGLDGPAQGSPGGSCECNLTVNREKASLNCEESVCLSGRTYTCTAAGIRDAVGCAKSGSATATPSGGSRQSDSGTSKPQSGSAPKADAGLAPPPEREPDAPVVVEGADITIDGAARKIHCAKAVRYAGGGADPFVSIEKCDEPTLRELTISLHQTGSDRECIFGLHDNFNPDDLRITYADGTELHSLNSKSTCTHTVANLGNGFTSGRMNTAVFNAKHEKKFMFDVKYVASISPF